MMVQEGFSALLLVVTQAFKLILSCGSFILSDGLSSFTSVNTEQAYLFSKSLRLKNQMSPSSQTIARRS